MTYSNFNESENSYIRCKSVNEKMGENLRLTHIDVSGANWYGYDYELVLQKRAPESCGWNTIATIAHSETVWFEHEKNQIRQDRCFVVMFKLDDIETAKQHPAWKLAQAEIEKNRARNRFHLMQQYQHIADPVLFDWLVDDTKPIPEHVHEMKRTSGLSWTQFKNQFSKTEATK